MPSTQPEIPYAFIAYIQDFKEIVSVVVVVF